VFYRGGGGAEGTKTHEKLILLEADLANHGRVSRDLTDEEIMWTVVLLEEQATLV